MTTSKTRYARLRAYVAGEHGDALATIEKFRTDLAANPAHALDWSARAFNAAAMYEVAGAVLAWLDATQRSEEERVAAVVAELEREVLRRACTPPRSSSAQSNLLDVERLAARAEILEKWRNWILPMEET